jgi:quercetin dioxygenase-like cupin family protein
MYFTLPGNARRKTMKESVNIIETGTIITLESNLNVSELPWNAHPKCQGVALKHVITGNMTGGQLSCHIVRVQAGCEISEHVHPDKLELHEVLIGHGHGILKNKEVPYQAGVSVIIPANEPHRVIAGTEDIYLLAKFTPALL